MLCVFSPDAQADIEAIWDAGARIWGIKQADSYFRQIQYSVQMLCENPLIGKICDEVRLGYRKYPAGAHVLFYRVGETELEIVRILHQRMDYDRHF